MQQAVRRVALVALAGAAYWVGFQPSWFVRDAVLEAFGNPPYQDIWLLIPHVFLYSTLQALFCLAVWTLLVKARWLPPLSLALNGRVLGWGLAAGVLSLALTVAYFYATDQASAFHAPHIDPWRMGANLFSNFYEEFAFRGFILVALAAALGFWPAAVLSSVAFAAMHSQYPISLQAVIAVAALLWAWAGRRASSLLAPYAAHMTLDWLVDPIL
jgi:membrane protease YdiL (CAAX protease family)